MLAYCPHFAIQPSPVSQLPPPGPEDVFVQSIISIMKLIHGGGWGTWCWRESCVVCQNKESWQAWVLWASTCLSIVEIGNQGPAGWFSWLCLTLSFSSGYILGCEIEPLAGVQVQHRVCLGFSPFPSVPLPAYAHTLPRSLNKERKLKATTCQHFSGINLSQWTCLSKPREFSASSQLLHSIKKMHYTLGILSLPRKLWLKDGSGEHEQGFFLTAKMYQFLQGNISKLKLILKSSHVYLF